jgi:two-component system chemotaxis response regulator CheB
MRHPIRIDHPVCPTREARSPAFDVVVIAASLGGPDVLAQVLASLPSDFPVPVLIVQHLAAHPRSYLPELLASSTQLPVRHAKAGDRLQRATVYVAPQGRHLVIDSDGRCGLLDGPRVSFARPSADRLFRSAAAVFGARALGVVLTGRLSDGAGGAEAIRSAGGLVMAQAPETCRAPEMPLAAIELGAVALTLPPKALGAALHTLVAVPGVPALFGLAQRPAA